MKKILCFLVIIQAISCNYLSNILDKEKKDKTPPSVLRTDPYSDEVNIAVNNNITVSFNKNMDTSTINPASIKVNDGTANISIDIECTDKTTAIKPQTNLINNNVYTVTLSTDIKDINGNPLQVYSWNFTTVEKNFRLKTKNSLIPSNLNPEEIITEEIYIYKYNEINNLAEIEVFFPPYPNDHFYKLYEYDEKNRQTRETKISIDIEFTNTSYTDYSYSEDDNLMSEYYYKEDVLFSYNIYLYENLKLMKKERYNSSNTLTNFETYEYYNNGLLYQESRYLASGLINYSYRYIYNSNNNQLVKTKYNSENNPVQITDYIYNSKNELIEIITNCAGCEDPENYRSYTSYEYDSYGNNIETVYYTQPGDEQIISRSYTYEYEEY